MPALIAGFPIWWALGLGELIFPLAGAAMLFDLARRDHVAVPRTFALYAMFVMAVAASGLMLDRPSAIMGWATRISQYAGVGMILPYALTHRKFLTAERLLRAAVWLWIWAIVGGLAALVLGPLSFPTPMKFLLPGGVAANPFVFEQINPSLADVDGFLGVRSVRPKAPFTYTNGWGAALGLLFPAAAYAALRPIGIPRLVVRASLVVGAIPIVFSLNRGLWLSICAGMLYGAVLMVRRHGSRVMVGLLIGAVVAAIAIALSPLGSMIQQRAETPHSNEDRTELYVAVIDELGNSPLFGFGGPRSTDDGPPLGTHGQLWIVLFSHGVVGAVLYFGFMATALIDSAHGRTDAELVAHTMMVVAGIQVFFYGHVPQQLAIVFLAIAVSYIRRFETLESRAAPTPSPQLTGAIS